MHQRAEDSAAPRDIAALEERLSRPDARALRALADLPGDIIVLGAGGKMGPSLTRMLRRASIANRDGRRIIAVSRFSGSTSPSLASDAIEGSDGIEVLARDLTSLDDVRSLPAVPNVIYMAGQKFGTRDDPASTWAMNAAVPALVANHFSNSRIVVFSTGNVYPLTAADAGGSVESDLPGPIGEYAVSCLARERIFYWYSAMRGTSAALLRLNYAVDLRYGVLVDVANKVWRGEPVDVTMGYFNAIWQGDANSYAIAALQICSSPATALNVAGTLTLSVRDVATRFGELLEREVILTGSEQPDALLSNNARARTMLGAPGVSEDLLMQWVAQWIRTGGELLAKPTHFEKRDGSF